MKEYLTFRESLWESLKPFQQAHLIMKITRKSSLNIVLKEIFHHVRPPYLLKERKCKFKLDSREEIAQLTFYPSLMSRDQSGPLTTLSDF